MTHLQKLLVAVILGITLVITLTTVDSYKYKEGKTFCVLNTLPDGTPNKFVAKVYYRFLFNKKAAYIAGPSIEGYPPVNFLAVINDDVIDYWDKTCK